MAVEMVTTSLQTAYVSKFNVVIVGVLDARCSGPSVDHSCFCSPIAHLGTTHESVGKTADLFNVSSLASSNYSEDHEVKALKVSTLMRLAISMLQEHIGK